MKTPNQINKYYDQRLQTVELLTKKRLDSFVIKNELEFERLQMKLERKKQSAIKKIELDRKKKLKSLETGKPVVKKAKEKTNARYKNKADWYFSRCIRAIWCVMLDWVYQNQCVTTGQYIPIKDLTCWHYVTRWNMSTRYSVINCRPQSKWANQAEHLDPQKKEIFRKELVKECWEETIYNLERSANSIWDINVKEEHERREKIYLEKFKKYYV